MAKTGKRKIVNKSKKVKRSDKKTKRVIRRGRKTRKTGGSNANIPTDKINLIVDDTTRKAKVLLLASNSSKDHVKQRHIKRIKELADMYFNKGYFYGGRADLLEKFIFTPSDKLKYEMHDQKLRTNKNFSEIVTIYMTGKAPIGWVKEVVNAANKHVLQNFDIATDGKVTPKSTVAVPDETVVKDVEIEVEHQADAETNPKADTEADTEYDTETDTETDSERGDQRTME